MFDVARAFVIGAQNLPEGFNTFRESRHGSSGARMVRGSLLGFVVGMLGKQVLG